MKQINMRFLSSVFVLCAFGIAGAHAVPSVKMLGANTARAGATTTVMNADARTAAKKTSSASAPQRLGSVRVKPTPVMPSSGSTASVDTSRLSLSNASVNKYLHAPVVNKPTATTKPAVSEQDFTDLSDKVQDLETGIEGKQDALTAGEGLVLDTDNNVMYLDEDYAQLPNQVTELQEDVDAKANKTDLNNYYTKYEIDGLINSQGVVDIKTIYDYKTEDRKYVTIVDDFDEAILN